MTKAPKAPLKLRERERGRLRGNFSLPSRSIHRLRGGLAVGMGRLWARPPIHTYTLQKKSVPLFHQQELVARPRENLAKIRLSHGSLNRRPNYTSRTISAAALG
jgi:hypothetical protein